MKHLLVIGVSGTGKSTIGARIAEHFHGTFLDADDLHPAENIEKMAAGEPLTDQDRKPWLERCVREMRRHETHSPVILACSALKRKYRSIFHDAFPDLQVIYLKGSYELIRERMQRRTGHFMKAGMLRSQFADLEVPVCAISVSVDQPIDDIVTEILAALPPAS